MTIDRKCDDDGCFSSCLDCCATSRSRLPIPLPAAHSSALLPVCALSDTTQHVVAPLSSISQSLCHALRNRVTALTGAERKRRYRQLHPDRIKAAQKKHGADYYKGNKEKVKQRKRSYRQKLGELAMAAARKQREADSADLRQRRAATREKGKAKQKAFVPSDDSDPELPSEADSTSTTAAAPPSPSQPAHAASYQALSISTADTASSASSPKAASSSSSTARSFPYFLCLLYAFSLMGLDMGLLGPSLLELAVQTSSSIAAMSFVFAARSVGLLVGTLVAGYLIDRFPLRGHVILTTGAVLISCVTIVFPLMPSLYLLMAMGWLHGCTMGLVDNTTQVLLIRQYGERVPPYMQALHCAFGFGSLFSPLVLAPFLSQTSLSRDADVDGALVAYDSSFHYAWLILGLTGLPCSLCLLYYTKTKDYPQLDISLAALFASSAASSGDVDAPAATLQPPSPTTPPLTPTAGWHEAGQQSSVLSAAEAAAEHRFQVKVILNVGLFLTFYVGCETGYGSYIYAYAVTQLGASADTAAYLNSTYWASFAVGRAIGVPVSMRFSPQQMVLADLSGCILAIVINLSFLSSLSALWLGTALYGLSVGSVYASAINYTEHLVGVNGRLLSYLTFFAALGDAVVPFTMGRLFDAAWAGPVGMMWIVVVVAAAATTVFGFLCGCVARERRGKNKIREDEKERQTARAAEEEEEEADSEQQAAGQRGGRVLESGTQAVKRGRQGYNRLTNGVEHHEDANADWWQEEDEEQDGGDEDVHERELR